MKKSLLYFIILLFMLGFSCSISKDVREERNEISGSWLLDNISYENSQGNFKSVLFNDADAVCFEGSDWYFRDNNSTGRYTLKQGSLCSGGDRYIRWSISDQGSGSRQLQFKFIDEDNKDVGDGTGYRLNITELTEQQMTLKSNVSVDGQPVTIVYEFSRKI